MGRIRAAAASRDAPALRSSVHSAGAVGAGACSDRAGSIDDLFCGLLRVVSGRLPPRATRRLSAHAAALRSTTVGWAVGAAMARVRGHRLAALAEIAPVPSEFKSFFKNKISKWETGYKQTPQIKTTGPSATLPTASKRALRTAPSTPAATQEEAPGPQTTRARAPWDAATQAPPTRSRA